MASEPRTGPLSLDLAFVARAEARGLVPACREAGPVLFFPERTGPSQWQVAQAKRICAGCALLEDCRDYALSWPTTALYGVWGGLSHDDRIAIRARRSL